MLPSLRNRLCITISPERISLLRLGRGLKPKLLDSYDEAIPSSDTQLPWQAALEKLAELSAKSEWQNSEADIVLSNKLVRHTVIPFNTGLKKYPEQEAFARHILANTYGTVTSQWELRIQQQGIGAPWVVSALDRALLESLRQTLAAGKIKLRSVTSRLMQEYNHHIKSIQCDPSWLVVRESDHSQFALLSEGKIISVNGVNHPSLQELPLLLDRENLAATLAEPCRTVYLDLPEDEAMPPVSANQYEILQLEATQPQNIASFFRELSFLPPNKKGAGKIGLDFQKPAQRPNRNAGWMLLAAGLALMVEMGVSYDSLHNDQAAMERKIAASKLRLDDAIFDQRSAQYTEKDFDAARKIISRLATPWEAFFSGLESVSNKHVAILSVVPEMQTGVLRIMGEAKDNAALLTLVAQLRATKPFSEVYLSSQKTKLDSPQHPVEFIIYMHWGKPA